MGIFTNSEDPDEMPHNVAFHQGLNCCKGKNDLQTKDYNILMQMYNLTPQDMYNGLSQVYCSKPEGRVH